MRLTLSTVLVIVLAGALFAQVPQKQQPTFRAGVNLVRVDVYPTIDGRAVADLTRDDFEVREDGVAQRIETFERIVAREPSAEVLRSDPRSQNEANIAASDPRTRLFVVFFDTLHTAGYKGSDAITYDPRRVGVALSGFLGRVIGADDLVGLMVPEMRAESIVFTRRPLSFQEFLETGAGFERRFVNGNLDDTERLYESCYPPGGPPAETADFAAKMIARRREMLLIGALHDLVAHLNNLREGRKAVLVVSRGWTLFTPDSSLAGERRHNRPPTAPPIGVDKGQPTLRDPRSGNPAIADCERDRLMLAGINNEIDFRALLNEANRANVTFYPIDPAGLTPESTFNRRSDSLLTLASATDGTALINSNDFTPGLRRVADDLSSYYLLGYYSSNGRADGTFRKIAVTVKRPKVVVRARRGYTAPSAEEAAERARSEKTDGDPNAEPRDRTLATLATIRADRPVHVSAGYGWRGGTDGQSPAPALWIAADVDLQAWRLMPWSSGGDASITVVSGEQVVATTRGELAALSPRFLLWMTDQQLAPGQYDVRVKVQPKLGAADDVTATVHVQVPRDSEGPLLAAPVLLFRRGPFTGSGFQPTADLRFRKSERLRADVPVPAAPAEIKARLLDRKGHELPIPVNAGAREEGGFRFASAEIALAPLAQGDYLLEFVRGTGAKVENKLVAFRIVP